MAGVGVGNWIGGPDVHSDGHRTKELDGPSVGDRTVGQGDPSPGEESDDAEYDTDLEVPAGYGQDDCEVRLAVVQSVYSQGDRRDTEVKHGSPRLGDRKEPHTQHVFFYIIDTTPSRDNIRVERLNLDSCDIGPRGGAFVSAMLLENVTLQEVNLANNNLGFEGARAIGHMMTQNDILKHLNLSGNNLADDTAWFLSRGLQDNTGLISLNLSHNDFGETGGKVIAAGLVENVRLQRLDISWNKLRGVGSVPLLQALKVNYMMRVLDISWNGLGYEGTIAVAEMLAHNKTLKELNISNNRINWSGASLIAKALRTNTSLDVLKIGGNPLTTTGCMDILLSLSSDNSVLRILDAIGVSVMIESIVLAATIRSQRKFTFIHGDIVSTPDVLGERQLREKTPMERVLDYMRRIGIRPIDLIRQFDKSATMEMTAEAFIRRLEMTDIELHGFERRALAHAIAKKGREKDDVIDYPKFWVAVETKRIEIRQEKINKREEEKKMDRYHQKVLRSGIPVPLECRSSNEIHNPARTTSQQGLLASKSVSMLNNKPLPIETVTSLSQIKSPKKKTRDRKRTGHKTKKT
ncbi:hypothetical protein ScPMuIL_013328 [Solemya velum]